MKEDISALDEIHKGASMGKDAIDYVLDKVEDKNLEKELKREYKNYKSVVNHIEKIYPKYNDDKPLEASIMVKAMSWSGVEMKTLTDRSNSKIAELLLNGLNMGIIEGRKMLNQKKLNDEVHAIISDYVSMQEESVEILKEYL